MIILPPQTQPRTRQQLAAFVISSIEAAGVRVPAASRLRRMHDLYFSGIATIEPDHPDFEIALEAERDMQILGFVFDQCNSTEPSAAYLQLLKKLVSDAVLPQQDRENSSGRDAAFELYVGAVCMSAQLLPVAWEEPDVTCALNNVKYAFAAKRIKNEKRLEERVRKAVEQIDRSGLPGVIVLDAFLAFNPDNHRIRQMADTIFWSEYYENFKVTWSQYQPKMQKLMARGNVLGIVLHDYQVRMQDGEWALAGMSMWVTAEARDIEDQRRFVELSTLYTYGLPNQEDELNRKIILP